MSEIERTPACRTHCEAWRARCQNVRLHRGRSPFGDLSKRMCRFGQYTKDESSTFNMLPAMTFYPGFMFHLRRSTFVQVFGNSPDETAFSRLLLYKCAPAPLPGLPMCPASALTRPAHLRCMHLLA